MKEIKPSQSIQAEEGWNQYVLPGYENEIAGLLNSKKLEELNKIFTNPGGRVTAIRPGPRDITAAVLTARLSRAGERDVTELFWKEFLNETGEKVGDRVLNEYGDDSVREDASGYIFVRDVSVLTSMQAFRHPLITGIEASTRYINWGELPLNDFAVMPEKIMSDPEARGVYLGAVKISYDAYKTLWPEVWNYFIRSNPREAGQSEAAYKKAIKGATCDALRGILILGTKTNFGMHATFRTFSEEIMDLRASDLPETVDMANEVAEELMKINPVFLKVVDSEHGERWTDYKKKVDKILKGFGVAKKSTLKTGNEMKVSVEILNKNWSRDLLRAALVSMNGNRAPLSDSNLYTEFLGYNSFFNLLKEVGEARTNRRHKIPDFINAVVTRSSFENVSFGSYKDFNRHRFLLAKSQPDFTGSHGHITPKEIKEMGKEVEGLYNKVQEEIHDRMVKLSERFPEEAKLLLTHGTKTSFEIISGGGEDYWISELRSSPGGNPEYREIAMELYKGLIESATPLKDLGSFVDEKNYSLGRMGEAIRADLKGKNK